MRSTRTPRTLLLAAAAIATAGPVFAAPASADVSVGPGEQVISPAPTGYYLWQRANARLIDGMPVLWPDATEYVFTSQDGLSAPSGPGIASVLDAEGGAPLTTAADWPTPTGSLFGASLRLREGYWDFEDAVVGIGGGNWIAETASDGAVATIVSERDEDLISSLERRGGFGPGLDGGGTQLVATTDGLRSVTSEPYGKRPRFVVRDRVNRRIATFPLKSGKAVASPGGAIIVVGGNGVVRVTAHGSTKRVGGPLGPQPARSRPWYVEQVVSVPNGAVVAYRNARGINPPLRLAKITSGGRVRGSVAVSDLELPWSGACSAGDANGPSASVSVDAAGKVVLSASCPGSSSTGRQSLVAELGPGFTLRRMIATSTDQSLAVRGSLPDGRLVVAHAPVNGESAWTIGAFPIDGAKVVRGTAELRGRGTSASVRARLRCKLPVGGICSGVATVRTAGGTVLGWAPYSLPGRPGRTETVFDRTIPLAAGQAAGLLSPSGRLPKGARVVLTPLPEHLDRTAVQPPLVG